MKKPRNEISDQLKHELMSWLRLIEFYRQENALLKYRLSELVDSSEDKKFLQLAERFQNEFLSEDDTLKKLLKNVRQYLDWLEDENEKTSDILNNHHILRDEILRFEKNFIRVSAAFNQTMLQALSI
ncbi:MAG: hypothetical protein ACTHM7_03410 [Ginsengibacter sp.]